MKKIIAAILTVVALTLVLAVTATAQVATTYYGPNARWVPTASITGGIFTNAMTSSALTNTFEVTGKEFSFQLDAKANGLTRSNITVLVFKTHDGITWDPNQIGAMSLTLNDMTNVVMVTNITVNATKKVRLVLTTATGVGASAGIGATNLVIQPWTK